MDAYVCDGGRRANRSDGCDNCRSGKFRNFRVNLRNVSAAERDGNGMTTWVARLGFHRRVVFVAALHVVIRQGKMVMLVRGRTVVVFRMIVLEVLVDVQRRHRGRRYDQGLHQHECDESAHGDSLSEAAPPGTQVPAASTALTGDQEAFRDFPPDLLLQLSAANAETKRAQLRSGT